MTTADLASQLDAERAEAIQHLLRAPLLDAEVDHDAYSLVARHAPWLTEWFDSACGWTLHVDPAAGFARLAKRRAQPDPSRPLHRQRGSGAPFDRRRYQLLCLVAAELAGQPMTTVGILAQAVAAGGDFTPERHGDRLAFVDALLVLRSWRAVAVTSGELEDFVGNEKANALLVADLARLHRLVATATAPSRVAPEATFADALDAMLDEPRYGPRGQVDAADPHRRTRHDLARVLLDDPVCHLDECTDEQWEYLGSGAGRTWVRSRVAEAGLTLEERADGLLAVDPAARTSLDVFPGPHGTVHQMALLLVDHLVREVVDAAGVAVREPQVRTAGEVERAVAARLAAHPNWAKGYQEPGGAARLAHEAVSLLSAFGLVRRLPDGAIEARPALCRYRPAPADPTTVGAGAGARPRPPAPSPDPALSLF